MKYLRILFGLILCIFFFQGLPANENLESSYLGSREGDPASLVKNVSTIHGDYSEIEVDLVVPGPDPLTLSRYYSSRDSFTIANIGGWRFHPHCFLFVK
ncbi:MAG: hypothetical protein HYZ54_09365 [Ignavibacteriae bacterium]|nr:hypothetical protein [Ignavibacteriota bacterium]